VTSELASRIRLTLSVIFLQVCELDIIFNFEKAYFILDELLLGGEIQETSKKNVLKAIAAQDLLQEVSYGNAPIEL
jgi:AP-1 complex subunit sigma 1/2